MTTHNKNGILFMLFWIVFLTATYGSYSYFQGAPLSGLLDKETGGIISATFFIGWAIMWFAIGRHFSYDYAAKKEVFCNQYPSLDRDVVRKAFKYAYTSKIAKMLSKLFFVSVFVYVAANVREEVTQRNCIYIGILMCLSIVTFWYYKTHRNIDVA